jgi:hypothetical protein
MEIFRIRPNGERYEPYRNKAGYYVMADPKNGRVKHHAKHEVLVQDLTEFQKRIIRDGFHLWMKGQDTGLQSLTSSRSI